MCIRDRPRLMFKASACLARARSCSRSIIALRSANLPCRALLPKNRSPASALRSWRAAHVDGRLCRSVAAGTENIGSPAVKLRFPRCDLIGVDIELLRKLRQCSIALDGGKRHLCLEARCVVASGGHDVVDLYFHLLTGEVLRHPQPICLGHST